MSTDESCETCRFWWGLRSKKKYLADCRAHPPQYMTVVLTVWGQTKNDDWCGEYQASKSDRRTP